MKNIRELSSEQINKFEYIQEFINLNEKKIKTNIYEVLNEFKQLEKKELTEIKEDYANTMNLSNLNGLSFSYYKKNINLKCKDLTHINHPYLVDEISIDCVEKKVINLKNTKAKSVYINIGDEGKSIDGPIIDEIKLSNNTEHLKIDNEDDEPYQFTFKQVDLKNIKYLELSFFEDQKQFTTAFKKSETLEKLSISGDWDNVPNLEMINKIFPNLKTLKLLYMLPLTDLSNLNSSINKLIIYNNYEQNEHEHWYEDFEKLMKKEKISKKDIRNLKKTYKIPDTLETIKYDGHKHSNSKIINLK